MTDKSLGVLGGGQLATMLREAGRRVDSELALFTGATSDTESLQHFFQQHPVILFENEFLDTQLLASLAAPSQVFFPKLDIIRRIQDKLEQKKIFHDLGLPSPAFEVIKSITDLPATRPLVLKWSRQGYDGKGVLFLKSDTPQIRIDDFFQAAAQKHSQIYAETAIDFDRELALVSTVDLHGQIVHYPLVESVQKNGICERVLGPAASIGLASKLQTESEAMAKRLAGGLGLSGTFAIEFFLTRKGELLINEVAPRVHNSGHFSQDATLCSQFENHVRAARGLPLGSTDSAAAFLMLNMLGPLDLRFTPPEAPHFPTPPDSRLFLHWYDKGEVRPGRKLGHINARSSDPADLNILMGLAEKYRQDCFEYLKELSRHEKEKS